MSVPPPDGWLPLTAAQLGVYFLHQLQPDTPVCSTAELVELPPGLDVERLVAALRSTYAENEQLRVRFRTGPDGPQQQVLAGSADVAVVAVADRSAADAWIEQRLAVPFTLEDGDVAMHPGSTVTLRQCQVSPRAVQALGFESGPGCAMRCVRMLGSSQSGV